jgi:hypothetical protein
MLLTKLMDGETEVLFIPHCSKPPNVSGQAMPTHQQRTNDKINMNRKVILYIATSLDGYIAKQNDDLEFL